MSDNSDYGKIFFVKVSPVDFCPLFNWQLPDWPAFFFDRRALRDELTAFSKAFQSVKGCINTPQDPETVARTLTAEAVTTSAIEGVEVDASVVMSSICKALGAPGAQTGTVKDVRAEGVAQMMLDVREDWNASVSVALIKKWHRALLAGDPRGIRPGAFRQVPVRVVSINAFGETDIRFEAPPPECLPSEIAKFTSRWRRKALTPENVALKAALMHPHFESIHPFEDGNGRVGRALVAKTLCEGLGFPLVLPVSTIVARHRRAYYDEINLASKSLDWTSWAAFFIPVLTELLTDFMSAARFVRAKREFLDKYERIVSERARKVFMRMFKDGEAGARASLSAAKWMRMTKVSKATATRDLAELAAIGAIIPDGAGAQKRYYLDCGVGESLEPMNEPMSDGINSELGQRVVEALIRHPGKNVPFLVANLHSSKATMERIVAALVATGKIEHRGSRKTGGYFAINTLA